MSNSKQTRLSVIMPCYNEEKTIYEIIKKINNVKINKEIIIVNDGSTDQTSNMLKKIKQKNIKIIENPKNEGRANAIKKAIEKASGNIIILQDADLEYDPEDYYKIIEPINNGESQIVFGSRYLERKKWKMNRYLLCTKILNILANVLYKTNLTDQATCYKAFNINIIKDLKIKSKRFEFDSEFVAKVSKKGYRIKEVPISYYPRTTKEGKKVKFRDGLEAIYTIIKYRFIN